MCKGRPNNVGGRYLRGFYKITSEKGVKIKKGLRGRGLLQGPLSKSVRSREKKTHVKVQKKINPLLSRGYWKGISTTGWSKTQGQMTFRNKTVGKRGK